MTRKSGRVDYCNALEKHRSLKAIRRFESGLFRKKQTLKEMKNFICKIFGHKYVCDLENLLSLKLICERCGHDNTIFSIKEHIEKQLNSFSTNNLKIIKEEIENGKIGGRWCTDGSKIGLIVGAVSTIEDYYYVVLTPETYKVQYWSCVGNVKPINHENEYGFEKMFPKALKALVEEQLEKDEKVQVLFTKLMINSI